VYAFNTPDWYSFFKHALADEGQRVVLDDIIEQMEKVAVNTKWRQNEK
jgi:hypothetical protein